MALTITAAPTVYSQTQYVQATSGYVNLGFTTSIVATAPAAGSYTIVVAQPNGTQAALNFSPSSAGQMMKAAYGNSTVGFKALVDQVGTYNVFLEQGTQVVSATSFYATNKLNIAIEMITAGTCDYVSGITRGEKIIPHTWVTYTSNGAPWTNKVAGASIKYSLPSGAVVAGVWDPYASAWKTVVATNWNYTSVGSWNPRINASDAAGNIGIFKYTGSPFTISPVQLATSITVLNTTSGELVYTLLNGLGVTIQAKISYPTNAEPVTGFVGPLSLTRGGSVTAQVGWGYYNTTSGTFGGKSPGALLGTVLMTYSGTNGTWTGQFESSNLPTLKAGYSFEVVVSSKDGASPANTGFAVETLSPGTAITTAVTTTATQTVQETTTATQTVQEIPDVVYAALVILLIVGVLVGYIVRAPK
jgi:hypothetical protein